MRRQKTWRVRVVRKTEDWIDVQANSPLEAETLAATMPMVLSVFSGSAMRGDRPIDSTLPAGVQDDEDD